MFGANPIKILTPFDKFTLNHYDMFLEVELAFQALHFTLSKGVKSGIGLASDLLTRRSNMRVWS